MEGLSRTLGQGPAITLCGKKYPVKGRMLRHYATIEAEIIKLRGNPLNQIGMILKDLRAALDGLETVDAAMLIRETLSLLLDRQKEWSHVSLIDLQGFLSSWRGQCMQVWLAIRHNDPATLTLEKVSELFADSCEDAARSGDAGRADFMKEVTESIAQASAEDVTGN